VVWLKLPDEIIHKVFTFDNETSGQDFLGKTRKLVLTQVFAFTINYQDKAAI